MLNFGLVFFTVSLSIGANLSDGFLVRLGFDSNYLLAALAALVLTGLIARRSLALIVLIVLVTCGANVSPETAMSYGYDPDYLLAALIAIVVSPVICRDFG